MTGAMLPDAGDGAAVRRSPPRPSPTTRRGSRCSTGSAWSPSAPCCSASAPWRRTWRCRSPSTIDPIRADVLPQVARAGRRGRHRRGAARRAGARAPAAIVQRVRLARALALDPRLLVAEHPSASLPRDAVGRLRPRPGRDRVAARRRACWPSAPTASSCGRSAAPRSRSTRHRRAARSPGLLARLGPGMMRRANRRMASTARSCASSRRTASASSATTVTATGSSSPAACAPAASTACGSASASAFSAGMDAERTARHRHPPRAVGVTAPTRLVLFDIDGTLVLTGGAGKRAMDRAFDEPSASADAFADVPMGGRTDRFLIERGARALGHSRHRATPSTRFRDRYLAPSGRQHPRARRRAPRA